MSTFRIDDDFATGGGDLVGHEMVYSYDQQTGRFSTTTSAIASQDLFSFSNNAAFTQNQVYVAYGLAYPYSRTVDHAARRRREPLGDADGFRAAPSLVIGQSPGGVDDLGRTHRRSNIYGFKITDSESDGA